MKFNRYYKEQQKVSYDNGMSWEWLDVYRKGELIDTGNWNSKESCERGDEPDQEYPPYSILYSTNSSTTGHPFNINGNSTGIYAQPNKTDELVTFDVSDGITSLNRFSYSILNTTSINIVGEWDTTKVTDLSESFTSNTNLQNIKGLDKFITPNIENIQSMFSTCGNLKEVDFTNCVTKNLKNIQYLFYNDYKLTTIIGIENLNVENITSMANLFNRCESLTELDLSNWETANVNNTSYMFNYCTSLERLDLSKFDMSKVTNSRNYQYMFEKCSSLKYIKCTQAFKDWCEERKSSIGLSAGDLFNSITWDIVN